MYACASNHCPSWVLWILEYFFVCLFIYLCMFICLFVLLEKRWHTYSSKIYWGNHRNDGRTEVITEILIPQHLSTKYWQSIILCNQSNKSPHLMPNSCFKQYVLFLEFSCKPSFKCGTLLVLASLCEAKPTRWWDMNVLTKLFLLLVKGNTMVNSQCQPWLANASFISHPEFLIMSR